MSDLIVVGFKDEFKADEVLINLRKLELEYLTAVTEQAVDCRDYCQNSKKKKLEEF